MKIKPLKLSLAAILGLAVIVPVSAQDEVIEEVIVTATKREQTLQEVPVAVSVTDADVIEKAQINDILDLQSVVPSLRVTQLQSSANTNFVIRGFGNGANNAGIEPSVGVFIDGVYRSRSAGAISDLPNVQRVEVLRGPQSTLFGKNASAGVISVVTSKPSHEFGGYAEITTGNFDQRIGKAFVEGGITDNLAFSFGGSVNTRNGYFLNRRIGTQFNERDRWGARAQVLYTPTENSEFRLILDRDDINEICCGVSNLISQPQLEGLLNFIDDFNPLTPAYTPNDPFAYENYYNIPSTNDVENEGVSLQADFNFNSFDLTSITSVRNQTLKTNQDSDFTSADLIGTNRLDQDIDTISQEIRLTSTTDGPVSWLVGAFYLDEEVYLENELFYGDDFRTYADTLAMGGISQLEAALFPTMPGILQAPGTGVVDIGGQENESLSIFGQLDIDLSDRLVATIGLNYTQDEKEAFLRQRNNDVFSQIDLVQVGFGSIFSTLTGGQPPIPANFALFPAQFAQAQALSTTECTAMTGPLCNPLLGLQALQFLPPQLGYPNLVESGKSDDSDTTYTVRLAYDVNDNLNLYASVGTGFKATSWNLSRDSRPFATSQLDLVNAGLTQVNQTYGTRFAGPEQSTVHELGFKAKFDRGALNVAVFEQEIEGFQSNIFTGTGFSLANAGKQSTTGIEMDFLFDITDNLTWTFAGTFLDPTYDSFEGAAITLEEDVNDGSVDGIGSLTGTAPAGVHEVSATTAMTYNWTFTNGWDAFVRGDYIYESNVRVNENTPSSIMRQVNTWNGSFGLASPGGWNFTLWGRNLTDDRYLLSSFPTVIQTGSFSGYPNQPRTYGLTVRKTF